MNEISLTVPLPPSVNRLWRVKKGGGVYKSKDYTDWYKIATWEIALQAKFKCVKGEYKLIVKARKPDKRQRDLDNIIKALSDALQGSGVIVSDHYCQHLEMSWVKEGPECHVTIIGINDGKEI